MGDLTHNLSLHEFACRCNYDDCMHKESVDFTLVNVLQTACDDFGVKYGCRVRIKITGGNRCPKHNADEDGAPGSKHQYLNAADHKLFLMVDGEWRQVPPREQYAYYNDKYPDKYGLGLYSNRCHLDTRADKARWGT